MKISSLFRFLLIGLGLFAATLSVRAEDLRSVKARIDRRFDSVLALMDRGVIGENNRAMLEVRGGATAADQKLVTEENVDRREVYAALAAQSGSSADTVAAKRAQQIAAAARAGHWIQDARGTWYQKK
jgi:hypothetical protein